jgi:hypothetical protein
MNLRQTVHNVGARLVRACVGIGRAQAAPLRSDP